MNEGIDFNVLVSNVVSEKHYKHCRLCLKEVSQGVRFDDYIFHSDSVLQLSTVLTTLLGEEICQEIPGINSVCLECVNMIGKCHGFLNQCHDSTATLHKIFDNLTKTLDFDVDTIVDIVNKSIYITVDNEESKVMLIENETSPTNKQKSAKTEYYCKKCNIKFDHIEELTQHHSHVKCNETVCEVCCESFLNSTELDDHMVTHNIYKCSKCTQYKNSAESLKEHVDKVHATYICKYCGKSCRGSDKLQTHEENHNIAKNECPKCGKSYVTKDFFQKHVELCLEDRIDPHPYRAKIEKTYFCVKCGKGYSTPGGLRVHERFVHGNAQPHVCEHCGKKFTAPSYLKNHMVKHTGEKRFKCDICSNNFVTKEALLYHTRRHTGERPYSCKLCDERFVNASARAEHIKFKHVAPTLTCDICSRKFFTINFLRQHVSRHHDPSSKLYSGRNMIPPNVPGEQNMRIKLE